MPAPRKQYISLEPWSFFLRCTRDAFPTLSTFLTGRKILSKTVLPRPRAFQTIRIQTRIASAKEECPSAYEHAFSWNLAILGDFLVAGATAEQAGSGTQATSLIRSTSDEKPQNFCNGCKRKLSY